MKKIHLLVAVALVMVGMASCSQDDKDINGGSGTNGTNGAGGEVRLTLGFAGKKAVSRNGNTAESTAKPTTTWAGNIKDLIVLFVNEGNSVEDTREIKLDQFIDHQDKTTLQLILNNIKLPSDGKPYKAVYVIANSQQAEITHLRPGQSEENWTASNCKGYKIDSLLMKLVAYKDNDPEKPKGDAHGSSIYRQPAEIFVGHYAPSGGVNLASNNISIPVVLARAISLMRVRIKSGNSANNNIDFSGATASFRIRRASTSIDPDSCYRVGLNSDVLYIKAPFHTTDPTDGYIPDGMIIHGTDYKFWQDFKMFPGGTDDINKGDLKFDFVLIGHAPEGYQPAAPAAPFGPGGGDVLWAAAITKKISANHILEVNVTLNQVGVAIDPNNPVIPEPAKYANCTVTVGLADWGAIVSTDVPV